MDRHIALWPFLTGVWTDGGHYAIFNVSILALPKICIEYVILFGAQTIRSGANGKFWALSSKFRFANSLVFIIIKIKLITSAIRMLSCAIFRTRDITFVNICTENLPFIRAFTVRIKTLNREYHIIFVKINDTE